MATWTVEGLDRHLDSGIVWRVHWRCTGETDTAYGSVDVLPNGTIVPFEEVTEELALSWVKNHLEDFEKIDEALNKPKINNMATGLPWKGEE